MDKNKKKRKNDRKALYNTNAYLHFYHIDGFLAFYLDGDFISLFFPFITILACSLAFVRVTRKLIEHASISSRVYKSQTLHGSR